jgi:hypothetical protein
MAGKQATSSLERAVHEHLAVKPAAAGKLAL